MCFYICRHTPAVFYFPMNNNLVFKLLYRHISFWQMLGFALANLCGMAIVTTAIQFATDVLPIFSGSDSFMRPGQVVVTKRVNSLGTLAGKAPVFSDGEIAELKRQPFAERVGAFMPSQYGVFATVGSRSMGMEFSTQMFFEALPDEFVDVDPAQWHYKEGSGEVPIVLPQNYLNLYNFGFATSQGLPTVSEGIVKQVGIRLMLTGNSKTIEMKGRVVAFSKAVNTILVPQTFLEETNNILTDGRHSSPSRLVVKLANLTDDRLATFLAEHGYDTEGTDVNSAKTASFLRTTSGIVVVVGLVICALAFYVLLLSIFLLLQKHTAQIDNLLLLGYSPSRVARPFYIISIATNSIVLVVSIAVAVAMRMVYMPRFGELYPSMSPTHISLAIVVAVALYVTMVVLNYIAVKRKIMAIWHMHM